uniref:Protein SSUH2 homolog n=1 Tax=Arion vulgaris TaxID=1028688 RepID=A0A0B6Z1P1_9EUPU
MNENTALIGSATPQYSGAAFYPQGQAADSFPPDDKSSQLNTPYSQGGGSFPADAEGQDAEPTAPPTESMDQLPGYRNIGFDEANLAPPSYLEAVKGPPPTRQNIQSASTISNDDAREAILQHVSEHCCYGKTPAKEMNFTSMTSSSAFHYTLETYGEARATKWASEPYTGVGLIVTGSPPGPWDIQAQPPQMFKTSSLDVEVPNTASVKPCYKCHASGFRRCYTCMGSGRNRCTSCHGTGRVHDHRDGHHHHRSCTFCHGGWKRCYVCSGSGRLTCQKCQGRANLRWFILLTIKWTNHLDDHIVERSALPDILIRDVRGQTAFEEISPRVWPVNHFPEQEINSASNTLVSQHGSQFTSERILMQRQRVRVVPVTEVFYHYKDKNSTFFVYGDEHKVHAPDYPAKWCCGCSVL